MMNNKKIIGMTFPEVNDNPDGGLTTFLEPSILSVLPDGDNVEFLLKNTHYNDDDIELYICSVYISGVDSFINWAKQHDFNKIVVGGYQPTMVPEEFINYASKIVIGPCDDILSTIKQNGQIVNGISNFNRIARYDLFDSRLNQQAIPDKYFDDVVVSIWTSQGCTMHCDFCCTPIMSPKLIQKPISIIKKEIEFLKLYKPKFLFIRDENFTMQHDWIDRLKIISEIKAKIYLFASANSLNEDIIKTLKKYNVYMICLGLEEITKTYTKNKNLDYVVSLLKKYGIYTYLSFIINPLDVVGENNRKSYFEKLMKRIYELSPEMICGNFLMPFPGTIIWDKYSHLINKSDYKYYNSKIPFLVKDKNEQKQIRLALFNYQYEYYYSDFYNNHIREFNDDTLWDKIEGLSYYFKEL